MTKLAESIYSDFNAITREKDKIRGKVLELLKKHLAEDGPGLAAMVVVNDEVVLKEGYGYARIGEENWKITPDTVFELASLSKHLTAFGILMLIDRTTTGKRPDGGKYRELSFDTRLGSILEELPAWANKISIRNLLNHSSAIPAYDALRLRNIMTPGDYYQQVYYATGYWYAKMEGYEKLKDKEQYLTNDGARCLLSQEKKAGRPAIHFAYSNTGYVALAEVIRRVTGKPLRVFLKEEIFDRLGMNATFVYDDTVAGFTGHALCYRLPDDQGQPNYESIDGDTIFNYIHGDGNIHSTMNDLEKWVEAWNAIDNPEIEDPKAEDPNNVNNKKLIKRATFLKVYEPGLEGGKTTYWTGRRRYKYSSGMQIYRYRNRNVSSYAIHHGGNWLGFNSYLMRGHVTLHRQKKVFEVTVLVLSNYLSEWGTPIFPLEIGKKIAALYWPWKGKERYNPLERIGQQT